MLTCPDHLTREIPPACPDCEAMMATPADKMTPSQRAAEFQHWTRRILTVEFPTYHKRIEELVGRPVWTHELCTEGCRWLLEEIRTGKHPADLESHAINSINRVTGGKPVIAVRYTPGQP